MKRNATQAFFYCSPPSSHQIITAFEILFPWIFVTTNLTVNLFHSVSDIGKLEPLQEKSYEPGQLVINRLFGCRAVVMKCWNAKLVDKSIALGNVDTVKENADEQSLSESDLESLTNPPGPIGTIRGYSLLLDMPDATSCSYFYSGSTYIPDPDLRSEIKNERGMDYAFHEDLIPFTSSTPVPVRNRLWTDFFQYHLEGKKYFPSIIMADFIQSIKPALELRRVYRQTTHGVRVTIFPFFLGSIDSDFYWRYAVRIENLTSEPLTLRERFWKIYSMKGKLETISGKGVIGKEPVLTTSTPVFQYHSHTITKIPNTYMWGIYRFQKPSGATIDVKIPNIALKCAPDEVKPSEQTIETDPEPTDK
nr:polymerase delta interacting protein 2 [Hymenolepis microstoma]